jgi:hypothetical protein
MSSVEEELKREMLRLYEHWRDLLRYRAEYFRQMVAVEHAKRYRGPVGTAVYLISRPQTTGFSRIVAAGHPELTVEALIIQERFKSLFSDHVIEAAQTRLKALR